MVVLVCMCMAKTIIDKPCVVKTFIVGLNIVRRKDVKRDLATRIYNKNIEEIIRKICGNKAGRTEKITDF